MLHNGALQLNWPSLKGQKSNCPSSTSPCPCVQLADHFNAEVVAGTIASKQDAIDYLTWTFFYRRLLQNPSYYGLEGTKMEQVSAFLSDVVVANIATLQVRNKFPFL